MERNLDSLVRQAKNNINILSVTPLSNSYTVVHFEFQYRPKAGAQPHWVKTCEIMSNRSLNSEDALRDAIISLVKNARAGLEN